MIDPLKLALNPSEPLIPPGAPPPLHQLTPRLPAPVKLGPALDWSENDLSALAQVSSADITAAAALWRQDAPAALRDLLAAQVIDAEQARVSDLSVRLVNGQISLADWQGQMAARVKNLHVALGLVANGGLANTSAADLGFLGSLIKKQYRFLDRFARQVQSGAQSLDGSLVARANLYAQAARPTYEQMVARLANNGGATEEQSVLGGAEHCSECLDQAALGWQPIGTLIPIGERQCLANCHCRMSYR